MKKSVPFTKEQIIEYEKKVSKKFIKQMADNVGKTYVIAILKNILRKFLKHSNSRACIIKKVLGRYYYNKDEILKQRRDKYARFNGFDIRLKHCKKSSQFLI